MHPQGGFAVESDAERLALQRPLALEPAETGTEVEHATGAVDCLEPDLIALDLVDMGYQVAVEIGFRAIGLGADTQPKPQHDKAGQSTGSDGRLRTRNGLQRDHRALRRINCTV